MHVVGKIQAVAPTGDDLAKRSISALEAWSSTKFDADDGSGIAVIKHSQQEALIDRRDETAGENSLSTFEVLEPVLGGQLRTFARILASPNQVHFACTISVSTEGGLAPPNVDIYAPRFVREVIGLSRHWRYMGEAENIIARFIDVGANDVDTFLDLLQSPYRRLPIVVVSEFDGRTIGGDLHARLATDLCGLGHTCRLSRDAAWAITERLEKEWSAYNGAVRLFWPFRANRDQPRAHPLWTHDALLRRGQSEFEVSQWIRRQLRQRLFEASAFLGDDPAFERFAQAQLRVARDAHRASQTSQEEATAQEIQDLRDRLDEREAEIANLQANIDALTQALRSQAAVPRADGGDDAPPATVLDAIETARRRYKEQLAFADDLDDQATTLAADAGGPEKILRYLSVLAQMSVAISKGSLGKSIPIWLREAGVEASGESDTIKKSPTARAERTFRFDGEGIYCEYHAKPSDGVSPDQCVRIYFSAHDAMPCIRVGYVGRHF